MARFQINTPILFAPPNPLKVPDYKAPTYSVPSFANFFQSYFGSSNYNLSSPNSGKMLNGLKQCYETNKTANPLDACAYYINGFKRVAAL